MFCFGRFPLILSRIRENVVFLKRYGLMHSAYKPVSKQHDVLHNDQSHFFVFCFGRFTLILSRIRENVVFLTRYGFMHSAYKPVSKQHDVLHNDQSRYRPGVAQRVPVS